MSSNCEAAMDGARGPTRAEYMGYVSFKLELEPGCRQHASSTRLSCNTYIATLH